MNRTDLIQTVGIALSFIIAAASLSYSYAVNQDMKCMQEAVPKIVARVQVLNAAKDNLVAEQRALVAELTRITLDSKERGATTIQRGGARKLLEAVVTLHVALQQFPLSVQPFLDDDANEKLKNIVSYNLDALKAAQNADANSHSELEVFMAKVNEITKRSKQAVDFMTEQLSSMDGISIAKVVCA